MSKDQWKYLHKHFYVKYPLRHYSEVSELYAKIISNRMNNGKRIQVLIVKI